MKKSIRIRAIGALMLVFAGLLWLVGCGSPVSSGESGLQENQEKAETDIGSLVYKESMKTEYATQFSVDYYEGGYVLLTTVYDGAKYLVVPEGASTPEGLDSDITVIKRPVKNLYLVASAVMDLFCQLDAIDCIRFCGLEAEDWSIDQAREAMEAGNLIYAGKYSAPDYERIVADGCTLAIENMMISHSPEVMEKLAEFGIPTMIDYSSYESHPLGRVEWIRFYGAMLGREEEADAVFAGQEESLDRVTEEADTGKTVAFFYLATNGTVNVRKSSDYVPKMIELAGGTYVFEDLGSQEDHKSSVNMSMEEFYATAKDADYLIYNSTIEGQLQTVEDLLDKSSMLRDFQAVQNGHVFCMSSDMYQHMTAAGAFIEDVHAMLTGDDSHEMSYLYQLQ